MLVVRDLRYRYRDAAFALDVPALDMPAGGRLLVLGPSGSGKSTLLHLLAGVLAPPPGAVTLAGHDLGALPEAARDRVRGRHVGLVFQRPHLVGALTVADNLRLALSLSGAPPDPARVADTLARLDLADRAGARPHQLSLGQRQRVGIARAVLHRPSVVLADEPTSSLDDARAAAVRDLLAAEADAVGAALVVATHDRRMVDPAWPTLRLGAEPVSNNR